MIMICLVNPMARGFFVRDIQFPLNLSLKFSTKPNKPSNGRKFKYIFSEQSRLEHACLVNSAPPTIYINMSMHDFAGLWTKVGIYT